MLLLRAVVASHVQHCRSIRADETTRVVPLWLDGLAWCRSAAIAFGFMSLTTAKLRVELLWRAQVDELTGLLNRWALKRVAMREIQRCRTAEWSRWRW